jgi:hypothetical protein
LKNKPDAPREIMDVWDLEMSRALRGAAKFAYNERKPPKKAAEAEEYLNRFTKEKPKHPEAIRAQAEWAEMQGQ